MDNRICSSPLFPFLLDKHRNAEIPAYPDGVARTAGMRIFRATAQGGEVRAWDVPSRVGSIAIRKDGKGAICSLAKGFYALDFATGDAGLSDWMVGEKAKLANAGGSYAGVRGYRGQQQSSMMGEDTAIFDAGAERLADAVQALEEVADRLAEQPRGRRKRGR